MHTHTHHTHGHERWGERKDGKETDLGPKDPATSAAKGCARQLPRPHRHQPVARSLPLMQRKVEARMGQILLQ